MFKQLLTMAEPKVITTKTVELHPEDALQHLSVKLHNGQLTLAEGDQPQVVAKVTVSCAGSYADLAEKEGMEIFWKFDLFRTEVSFAQVKPKMIGTLFSAGYVRVDVELTLPRGVQKADIETHNGDVEIETFGGSLRLTTHNGEIRLREVGGSADFEMHNGDVHARAIGGDVTWTTHNGKVVIDSVQGRVRGETHNGKIRVQGCQQDVMIEAHKGDIAIEAAHVSGTWHLSTHYGYLDVKVPRDIDATLHIRTAVGSVSGDVLPVQASGFSQRFAATLGTGQHKIDLHTSKGNIDVRYLA